MAHGEKIVTKTGLCYLHTSNKFFVAIFISELRLDQFIGPTWLNIGPFGWIKDVNGHIEIHELEKNSN